MAWEQPVNTSWKQGTVTNNSYWETDISFGGTGWNPTGFTYNSLGDSETMMGTSQMLYGDVNLGLYIEGYTETRSGGRIVHIVNLYYTWNGNYNYLCGFNSDGGQGYWIDFKDVTVCVGRDNNGNYSAILACRYQATIYSAGDNKYYYIITRKNFTRSTEVVNLAFNLTATWQDAVISGFSNLGKMNNLYNYSAPPTINGASSPPSWITYVQSAVMVRNSEFVLNDGDHYLFGNSQWGLKIEIVDDTNAKRVRIAPMYNGSKLIDYNFGYSISKTLWNRTLDDVSIFLGIDETYHRGTFWLVYHYVLSNYTDPYYYSVTDQPDYRENTETIYNWLKAAPAIYTWTPVSRINGKMGNINLSQIIYLNDGDPVTGADSDDVNFTDASKLDILIQNAVYDNDAVTVTYDIPAGEYEYIKLVYKYGNVPEDIDDGTAIDITQDSTQQVITDIENPDNYWFIIFTDKTASVGYELITSEDTAVMYLLAGMF